MVEYIPFDTDWGFPQQQRVSINGVVYDFFFRRNKNGFAHLTVTKVNNEEVVLNTKMVIDNNFTARDPDTYKTLFTLYPSKITEEGAEVQVA